MRPYSITYDLDKPGQNYEQLISRLRRRGAVRVEYSQWLADSYAYRKIVLERDSPKLYFPYSGLPPRVPLEPSRAAESSSEDRLCQRFRGSDCFCRCVYQPPGAVNRRGLGLLLLLGQVSSKAKGLNSTFTP